MAGFRPRWAREYQESFPAPPPSTVFGMLLSLIGTERDEKEKFKDVQLSIAIAESSYDNGAIGRTKIFRKFRRVPQSPKEPDRSNTEEHKQWEQRDYLGRRPDYQELVLWLKFWVWVRDADEKDEQVGENADRIVQNIRNALDPGTRGSIVRYGGLSLGESSHLVNEIREKTPHDEGRFLQKDDGGFLTMPVWVDYSEENKSRIETFSLSDPMPLPQRPQEEKYWICITPNNMA